MRAFIQMHYLDDITACYKSSAKWQDFLSTVHTFADNSKYLR